MNKRLIKKKKKKNWKSTMVLMGGSETLPLCSEPLLPWRSVLWQLEICRLRLNTVCIMMKAIYSVIVIVVGADDQKSILLCLVTFRQYSALLSERKNCLFFFFPVLNLLC